MSNTVDLSFRISGGLLPIDHELVLAHALVNLMPWLESEKSVGILPIARGCWTTEGLLLGHRAQLVLRIPSSRVAEASRLSGLSLPIFGGLNLGAATCRDVQLTSTQYSAMVALGGDNETAFLQSCERHLASLGIRARMISGHRQHRLTENGKLTGFSLMLHELSLEHCRLLQQEGIGSGRLLGCGIFVAHKSVVAVGAESFPP